MIPFFNQSTDIVLSSQLETPDVNVHEVIDELQSQFEDFNSVPYNGPHYGGPDHHSSHENALLQ